MSKSKITKLENLCLKCDGGIIERIIKESDEEMEVQIKKCSNKKCNYQYGIKEFSKDYTVPKADA
jgi:hypothetical protein